VYAYFPLEKIATASLSPLNTALRITIAMVPRRVSMQLFFVFNLGANFPSS